MRKALHLMASFLPAMASLLGSVLLIVRIFGFPPGGSFDVSVVQECSLVLALLGAGLCIYLIVIRIIGRGAIRKGNHGVLFLVGTILIIQSYSIAWHLHEPLFRYKHTSGLLLLLSFGLIQAWIWDRDTRIEAGHKGNNKEISVLFKIIPFIGCSIFIINLIASLRTVRFEDAYITFRYGWNLAHGHGITWNVIDKIPAEGYTSFLYVLFSGLLLKLKIDPVIGTQTLNMFALAFLAFFMWRVTDILLDHKPWFLSTLPIWFFISFPATAFHVASGMETLFFSAAIAAVFWFAIRILRDIGDQTKNQYLLGISVLISGLTRPEGIAVGFIVFVILIIKLRYISSFRPITKAISLTLILPGSIYFLWRINHFKYFLPLSYYHKSFVGDVYAHAVRSVLFTDFAGMILLPFLAALIYLYISDSAPIGSVFLFVPSSILILFYSQVLAVAGIQYRFFFPYLFSFVILGSIFLIRLLARFKQNMPALNHTLLAVLLFGVITIGPFYYEARNSIIFLIEDIKYVEEQNNYWRIGRTLQNIRQNEVIGIGEVGLIGYMLRDYTLIDVTGLNDRYIARNPLSTEYLRSRDVNILVTFAYPQAPLGVYADVYRKVGEAFSDIEAEFDCVGNIRGFDVFIRKQPISFIQELLPQLKHSPDFDEGICLSKTTARWSPSTMKLPLEKWEYYDLDRIRNGDPFHFVVRDNDPILRISPLNVDAANYYNLIIEGIFPPPIDCNTLTVYFSRTDNAYDSEERSIYIPYSPSLEPQHIIANLKMHSEWYGNIRDIRIDPVCGMNTDESEIRFNLIEIVLN